MSVSLGEIGVIQTLEEVMDVVLHVGDLEDAEKVKVFDQHIRDVNF